MHWCYPHGFRYDGFPLPAHFHVFEQEADGGVLGLQGAQHAHVLPEQEALPRELEAVGFETQVLPEGGNIFPRFRGHSPAPARHREVGAGRAAEQQVYSRELVRVQVPHVPEVYGVGEVEGGLRHRVPVNLASEVAVHGQSRLPQGYPPAGHAVEERKHVHIILVFRGSCPGLVFPA